MKKIHSSPLLPLFLILLVVAACTSPSTFSPQVTAQEIAREEAIQQEYLRRMKLKGLVHGIARNKKSPAKRLQSVTSKLAPASADLCTDLQFRDPISCAYAVHLKSRGNNPDDFQAFADGKSVTITSGLIRFTDNDNELALIIAHEMAHNIMGHVDAQKQNMLAGALLGIALDSLASSQGYATRGEFTKMGLQGGRLAYSVPFEQEADYIALYLLARAGYDYSEAPELWRRMSLAFPDAIYMTTTHPSNAARYVVMRKTIAEIDRKKNAGAILIPTFKKR